MKFDIICVVGLPTSGKTTIVNYIASCTGFTAVSGGEHLREFIRKEPDSSLSKEIQNCIDNGTPAPVGIIMNFVKLKIRTKKTNGVVLDGIPKNEEYLCCLNELAKNIFGAHFSLRLLELKISKRMVFNRAIKRFSCLACSNTGVTIVCAQCGEICIQREDDLDKKNVNKRIEYYKEKMPNVIKKVKSYYDYFEVGTEVDLNAVKNSVNSLLF